MHGGGVKYVRSIKTGKRPAARMVRISWAEDQKEDMEARNSANESPVTSALGFATTNSLTSVVMPFHPFMFLVFIYSGFAFSGSQTSGIQECGNSRNNILVKPHFSSFKNLNSVDIINHLKI